MSVFVQDGLATEYERGGDPAGRPVVVHHGLMGSAGISPEWDDLAREHALDLISVARPGYGRSDPWPMAAIADWADQLAALLDGLEVERFGVVGISAGAPYSYAVAARLPGRVERVAVLSGLGKVDEDQTRACYPAPAQQAFAGFASGSEDDVRAFWTDSLQAGLAGLPEGHPWRQAVLDSLAHDTAGPTREAILQQRDWGFALEGLTTPVSMWHSREDDQVPFATAEIVAARIPTAALHVQAEAGHLPSAASARAAFAYLRATD